MLPTNVFCFLLIFLHVCYIHYAQGYGHAQSSVKPVIIVGAGVAGSKVAFELARSGVPFIIVEGTEIVGGRLRREKITKDGPYVEKGANWVQGYRKGEQFSDFTTNVLKLNMIETDFDDAYFMRRGKLVSDDEADPVWERVEQAVYDAYTMLNASYDASGNIVTDMSIKSALLASSGWEGQTPIEIAAMRFEIDYEYAAPSSRVSLHELTSFYDPGRVEVKDLFVKDPRGFRAVVEWLLTNAGIVDTTKSSQNLLLNAIVQKIDYSSSGASVTLEDGRIISGSAVVSTLPLGVLQHSLILDPRDPTGVKFNPPLPANKRLAISKIELADYMKLFIKFKKPIFTDDDPTFMMPLECDEDGFLNVHNLNKADYLPGENMILVTSVDALSRDLLCVNELKLLKKALRYVSRAAGRKIFWWEVENFVVPGWHTNRFARGAFTTRIPGLTYNDYQAFNEPVGALFFAGESHSPEYHGYVQGAWYSASRTAGDVLKFLETGVSMTKTPMKQIVPQVFKPRAMSRGFRRMMKKKESLFD